MKPKYKHFDSDLILVCHVMDQSIRLSRNEKSPMRDEYKQSVTNR